MTVIDQKGAKSKYIEWRREKKIKKTLTLIVILCMLKDKIGIIIQFLSKQIKYNYCTKNLMNPLYSIKYYFYIKYN